MQDIFLRHLVAENRGNVYICIAQKSRKGVELLFEKT